MNYLQYPRSSGQFLFERTIMDAITFVVIILTILAIAACIFYLAAVIWLCLTEGKSVDGSPVLNQRPARRSIDAPLLTEAESVSRGFSFKTRVLIRFATMTGIFIAAFFISQFVPDIAVYVGGK